MELKEKIQKGCLCSNSTAEDFEGFTAILKELKAQGYTRIIKAQDSWLSNWSPYSPKKHIHLIACKDLTEFNGIWDDVSRDKFLKYVCWNYIGNIESIRGLTRNKTFTIRNDWTRWKN